MADVLTVTNWAMRTTSNEIKMKLSSLKYILCGFSVTISQSLKLSIKMELFFKLIIFQQLLYSKHLFVWYHVISTAIFHLPCNPFFHPKLDNVEKLLENEHWVNAHNVILKSKLILYNEATSTHWVKVPDRT